MAFRMDVVDEFREIVVGAPNRIDGKVVNAAGSYAGSAVNNNAGAVAVIDVSQYQGKTLTYIRRKRTTTTDIGLMFYTGDYDGAVHSANKITDSGIKEATGASADGEYETHTATIPSTATYLATTFWLSDKDSFAASVWAVAPTEGLKKDLEDLEQNAVKKSDVVNDLGTGGVNVPLSAEQGKVIGNAITNLTEYTESDFVDNKSYWYIGENTAVGDTYTGATNTYSSTGNYFRYPKAFVLEAGDEITLAVRGASAARGWAIVDAETNIILDICPVSTSYINNPYRYVADRACKVYINNYVTSGYYFKVRTPKLGDIEKRADVIEGEIAEIKNAITESTQYDADDLVSGSYWNIGSPTVGSTISAPSIGQFSSFYYLPRIELKEGETIKIKTKGGNAGKAYLVVTKAFVVIACAAQDEDTRTTPYTYTATDDCYVYINCSGTTASQQFSTEIIGSSISQRVSDMQTAVDRLGNGIPKCIVNPRIDIRNANELRVLDIGNSFTVDALAYLQELITAANVDVSDLCIYRMVRSEGSFKTFIDSWNNSDSYSGSTGCFYTTTKELGGLVQLISGDTNLAKMHSAIKDARWDIILIHQVSNYADDVQDWEGSGSGGYLKEFLRIIKTYQPQAMIGHLWGHASRLNSTGGDTASLWAATKNGIYFLQSNYGIDFVIPVATAIENIRTSSLNTSSHSLSRDGHHLGYGLARYVAAATYYQTLICGRHGGSVVGNTCTHTVTTAEHNDVDSNHQDDLIDVTADNRQVAQTAAALACSDMFTIVNPDEVTI